MRDHLDQWSLNLPENMEEINLGALSQVPHYVI